MRKIIVFFLLLCVAVSVADDNVELKVSSERVSENILLVKLWNNEFNSISVISTDEGLVVIDTGMVPSIARKARELIVSQLGRDDFRYVINTHYHYDHANGNMVFHEATVIGHELTRQNLETISKTLPEFISSQEQRIPRWKKLAAESGEDGEFYQELALSYEMMCKEMRSDFSVVLPTVTFKDSMTLHLGNLSLELIFFGEGKHTGDDILIYCPQEKVLFTGDCFWDNIQISHNEKFNLDRWLEVAQIILEQDIESVISTHRGDLPPQIVKSWCRYLLDASSLLKDAVKEGETLEEIMATVTTENFPYILDIGLSREDVETQHEAGMKLLWNLITGHASTKVDKPY